MGLRKKWTKEEDKFLEENYKTKGCWYCAENLERNYNSIAKRYAQVFIKKEPKIIEIDREVWSYDKCKEEALKYKSKSGFNRANNTIYKYIKDNNWDELLSHIEIINPKPRGYWTYERCKEEALKYNTIVEFKKKCISAFNIIEKNRWFDELCLHLSRFDRKPKGYWSYDRCKEVALKYSNSTIFYKEASVVYEIIRKNKWFDLFEHLSSDRTTKYYWDYERCKEEALKYNTKSAFYRNSASAYSSSLKNKWIDDICSHMEHCGNLFKRLLYCYIFEDKHCYIGLTCNEEGRKAGHNHSGPVYNHKMKTGLKPEYMNLSDYIHVKEAIELEKKYIIEYRDNGYIMLNKTKGGELGTSKSKWNYETCKNESLKYKTRSEFSENCKGGYKVTCINRWMDEFYPSSIKKQIIWSLIITESKKYPNRHQLQRKCSSAYRYAKINNLLDNLYPKTNTN